jgi:photosynthetic reaction center M subunit
MADYQKSSLRCRSGPVHHGNRAHDGKHSRRESLSCSISIGRFGNAQIGPIYLGWTGCHVLMFGMARIQHHRHEHAGVSELGSDPVHSPVVLACAGTASSRPRTGTGAVESGRLVADRRSVPDISILLWWANTYRRARALKMGTHVAWAFAAAIWLFLVLGLFRPV